MNNTLLKGLAVLELLSRSDRPLTLSQIGRELGVVKSNVHRLMQALVDTRFVLRDEESGCYAPSIKLWELGSAVLAKLDLRHHAEKQMEALMGLTGESVHLSVLDGHEIVYVHKVDSLNPVRAYSQIGGRAPAYCVATGKAQLAFAGETVLREVAQALKRLKPFTERTLTDPAQFMKEMKRVREQGHAVNRGEWRDKVWGIATPIMDARGVVIAAIGISGPADRFKRSVMTPWTEAVIAAATDVGHALAGEQPMTALSRIRFGPR
ncbi:IclR family transcriptional regulator [Hydrogenophaga sp. BPS33]|uniref:IclR family transcriptional regulator n=1 Tax=Hydrogenophaga sp. BPS33 TaxID=2651974 RepID=UPI00131FDFCE|nr:IclR family transcriptional regulator [Hydrogenophaga sp. BPS33]QHE83540.1 IclR family transcriptional regulator [Hydrogenophaga sp. BPS33]